MGCCGCVEQGPETVSLLTASGHVLKLYAGQNKGRRRAEAGGDEDTYMDVLCVLKLLYHIVTKVRYKEALRPAWELPPLLVVVVVVVVVVAAVVRGTDVACCFLLPPLLARTSWTSARSGRRKSRPTPSPRSAAAAAST